MKINKRLILSTITIATTAFMLGGCGNTTKNANSATKANKATATAKVDNIKYVSIEKKDAAAYIDFAKNYVKDSINISDYKTETADKLTTFNNKYYRKEFAQKQNVEQTLQSDKTEQAILKYKGIQIDTVEKTTDDNQKDVVDVSGTAILHYDSDVDKKLNGKTCKMSFKVAVSNKYDNTYKIGGYNFSNAVALKK